MTQTNGNGAEKRTFRFLPLTLSIETLGGIATPVILRGTPLPARRSQVFSTAADNQKTVEISLLMGESPLAKNNVRVGRLLLSSIAEAARGQPQIMVTFEADQACRVTVSAVEKGSGSSTSLAFDDARAHLSREGIDRLMKRAEQAREGDERLLSLVEAKNRADSVIAKAEARLRERQEQGLARAGDKSLESGLASLGLALETEDAGKIRAAVEQVERLVAQPAFGDLAGMSGMADVFSAFFGPPQGIGQQKAASTRSPPRQQKSEGKVATSRRTVDQTGKVFGGGKFALDANLCFVIMPFEPGMRPVYDDHISVVAKSEGLRCLRADEIVGTDLITWDIWERINRARFLIADLTGKNANVFYEVGLAHALGKDIILITQTMDDVPFDLKGLRCIEYSFTPRGVKELEAKIKATIKEIMKTS